MESEQKAETRLKAADVVVPPKWSWLDRSAIEQLRERLAPELSEAVPFPEVVGDRRLLRYLRGNNYDIEVCAEKMGRMLRWRKEAGIDTIRQDIMDRGLTSPLQFPHGATMRDSYPIIMPSRRSLDKKGEPVSVERFAFNADELLKLMTVDEILRFHFYAMELKTIMLERWAQDMDAEREAAMRRGEAEALPEEDESWGALVRMVVIRDFQGFQLSSLTSFQCRSIVGHIISTTSDYYPEMLSTCFMINVPQVFYGSWRLIRAFLEQATIDKISISNKHFLRDVLKRIDPSQLPAFLGGESDLTYASPGEAADVALFREDKSTVADNRMKIYHTKQDRADMPNIMEVDSPPPGVPATPEGRPTSTGLLRRRGISPHYIGLYDEARYDSGARTRRRRSKAILSDLLFIATELAKPLVLGAFGVAYLALKVVAAAFVGPLRDMISAACLVVFAFALPMPSRAARKEAGAA